jgi:hypothetical protein
MPKLLPYLEGRRAELFGQALRLQGSAYAIPRLQHVLIVNQRVDRFPRLSSCYHEPHDGLAQRQPSQGLG